MVGGGTCFGQGTTELGLWAAADRADYASTYCLEMAEFFMYQNKRRDWKCHMMVRQKQTGLPL